MNVIAFIIIYVIIFTYFYTQIFKKEINTGLYTICIILSFISYLWVIYNTLIRPTDLKKSHIMGGCVFKIPENIYMPFINRDGKIEREECFDKWALGHVLGYLICGLFFPNEYQAILFISIMCEVLEYYGKCRSKLSDLFSNLFGYYIGSQLFKYNKIKLNLTASKKTFIIIYLINILGVSYMMHNRVKNFDSIKGVSTKDD
jgi:hypothetical protein